MGRVRGGCPRDDCRFGGHWRRGQRLALRLDRWLRRRAPEPVSAVPCFGSAAGHGRIAGWARRLPGFAAQAIFTADAVQVCLANELANTDTHCLLRDGLDHSIAERKQHQCRQTRRDRC